jgi:glucokinase
MPSPKRRAASPTSERRRPRARDGFALGVDLGATKVVALLVDRAGRVVRRSGRYEHANDGPGPVIDVLLEAVRSCLADAGPVPRSVGISVAAQVHPDASRIVYAPNLRWRNVDLAGHVARELGTRVAALNDGRASTFGEWKLGAGAGCADLFCLQIGTGVGGSAVVGGRLLDGGSNAAGEVGHLCLVSGGRRCHCPSSGCFEAYVGGWAVTERAQEAVRRDPIAGRALVARAGSVDALRADTVFAAARAGDALAGRLVEETERYLADGAVGLVNAFNPSLLVLGGGMVEGRPQFVSVVRRAARTRCQPSAASVRVVRSRLGDSAPAIGAALWARARFAEGTGRDRIPV